MEEVRRGELVFDLVTARVVGRHEDLSCELDSNWHGIDRTVGWQGGLFDHFLRLAAWEWTLPIQITGTIGRSLLAGSPR